MLSCDLNRELIFFMKELMCMVGRKMKDLLKNES